MRGLALAIGLFTAGCATCPVVEPVRIVEPVEVLVPVPVTRRPPAELLEPLRAELPEFISPAAPAASSALTPEGERRLRALLVLLRARVKAWEAWALEPASADGASQPPLKAVGH